MSVILKSNRYGYVVALKKNFTRKSMSMEKDLLKMSNYSNIMDKYLFTVKSMFYLLTPNETYFRNIEDVPPLVDQVI